jgi:hypothetical protein
MPTWKKILIKAAGFGAGFAIVSAIVLFIFVWWSSRPVKPKPWNTEAITAIYSGFGVDDDQYFRFYYTLQNKTDTDYTVNESTPFSISGRIIEGDLAQCADCIEVKKPFFIPAHDKLQLTLTFKYKYSDSLLASTNSEKDALHVRERQFLMDKYGRLNGFTIFDQDVRYKVELPGDWKKLNNETNSPSTRQ